MRKIIPLNDNWLFCKNFKQEHTSAEFVTDDFNPVAVPHCISELPLNYFDENLQRNISTYVRIFELDKKHAGSRIVLRFEGVLSYAEVYVNGIFVSSHKGDTPFEADISVPIRYDGENRIVVKADSTLRKDVPSQGVGGPMIAYGGLFRDVSLQIYKGEIIEDAFVSCSGFDTEEKQVRIDVELYKFFPDTTLKAVILDSSGNQVGELPEKAVLRENTVIKGVIKDARLWSIELPVIYTAKIELIREDKTIDTKLVDFGIRSINFSRGGFYLNGQKIKLIGLNRFDSYPHVGRAAPPSLQREDVRILKQELGCNMVRVHSAPSREFVEECDRAGLLVITDLSGDGYLGKSEWRDAVITTVSETVRAYRNNPSIIAWGVRINNSPDFDELYFKTSKAAKDLDGTRPTIGGRNFMGSRLYEDIFAYNDYKEGRLSRLNKTGRLFVPYLISEHTGKTYPVKIYDDKQRQTEQAIRHLRVIDKIFAKSDICGAIGMSFADFYSPSKKGSGDNINYYGVTDIYRNKKLAAYAYASQFSKNTVLELSSGLSPDEFSGKLYAFTNCDYIKVYRDGREIGDFYPSKKRFKYLPHPPIEIDNLFFDMMVVENFTPLQSKLFRYLSNCMRKRHILNLKFIDRLILKLLAKSLKTEVKKVRNLLVKYSLNPPDGIALSVEGYKDGACVIKKAIGGGGKNIIIKVDTQTPQKNQNKPLKIKCGKSFEIIKIDIEARDNDGNILDKCFEPVEVKCEGGVEVVGSGKVSLLGGKASVYIKTITVGNGNITVYCADTSKTIDLEVIE